MMRGRVAVAAATARPAARDARPAACACARHTCAPVRPPDAALRCEIWRSAFPASTPTTGLDFDQLARLSLSGGNIRSVALGAAFLAADTGAPVGMGHVVAAARGEFAKLERSVPSELTRLAGGMS